MKAIETQWKGYRFRSRLEARWAVFFEALRLDWEYEPEGFETRAGWYLPDFYIRDMDTWVEIKPTRALSEDENDRMLWFVADGRQKLLIADGVPTAKNYSILVPSTSCAPSCKNYADRNWFDHACLDCHEAGVEIENCAMNTVCWVAKYLWPNLHDTKPRLFWEPGGTEDAEDGPHFAFDAARAARFEHGESPRV